MQRESFATALEGGFIEEYSLDLLAKALTMRVDVLDAERLSSYQIGFVGISLLEFHDESVRQWERIEVTEIRIEEAPERSSTEEWKVWINFWDAAQLTLRCAAIRVDGEALS